MPGRMPPRHSATLLKALLGSAIVLIPISDVWSLPRYATGQVTPAEVDPASAAVPHLHLSEVAAVALPQDERPIALHAIGQGRLAVVMRSADVRVVDYVSPDPAARL